MSRSWRYIMAERAGDSRFGLLADPEADEELARTMEAIREAERAEQAGTDEAVQALDGALDYIAERMATALKNYLVFGNHTAAKVDRYQSVLDDLGENAAEALALYDTWKARR
jgi:hypothetical protein